MFLSLHVFTSRESETVEVRVADGLESASSVACGDDPCIRVEDAVALDLICGRFGRKDIRLETNVRARVVS